MDERSIISYFHDFFAFAVLELEVQELHHSLNNKNVGKVMKKSKQNNSF